MRKIANVRISDSRVKRVMIFESSNGVNLFTYNTLADSGGLGDVWFPTVEEADNVCAVQFGIQPEHWEQIDDPMDGCQHDWIAPVRVKGRDIGKPEWGVLERLENGIWHILANRNPE